MPDRGSSQPGTPPHLRVALDATPLLGQRTGIGVFVANALGALAERDDVALVAYAATWRRRGQLAASLPAGVSAVRAPMVAGALHEMWRRADHPVIEWWSGRVDVVHGTNYVCPPSRRAAEVVSVHDLSFVHYPELCERQSLRFPALVRRALRRGAFVHALSHSVAQEIVDVFGAPPERVRVVPLAVDTSALGSPAPAGAVTNGAVTNGAVPNGAVPNGAVPNGAAANGAAANEHGGPGRGAAGGRRPYVLSLARTEPRKDLPLLVAAFDAVAAAHPDVELVLAGPPGWDEEALNAAIGAARHRDRIRRLGWVPDAERTTLLRGATVLAYPSRYEGFGLPPLEAMAAGVPVVTTDAGAIPAVVGDAALVVPVGDLDALAAALDGLLASPPVRARLVAAGRARVAELSWERCAAGLVALYRDAVADRT